jgi:putative membrane protein
MTPVNTELPASTSLALARTRLAYERTLMAWIRTAVSLISFGFTIYKFFQYLHEDEPVRNASLLGSRGFALLMITIGIIALAFASLEHHRSLQTLRQKFGEFPRSLAAVVAGLIGILGLLGLVAVLLRL